MKRLHVLFFTLILVSQGFSQIPKDLKTIKKSIFPKEGFYLEVPQKLKNTKGVVVLFPGMFDHPYSIFLETTLVQECTDSGYRVMIPILSQDNDKFDLSDESMSTLNSMIDDELTSNNLKTNTKMIIGGFSIGGTRALKYFGFNSRLGSKAKNIFAVFAIDPPLDLKRLIKSDVKKGDSSLLKIFNQEIGRSVNINSQIINDYSIYNNDETSAMPEFIKTKLRIYSEPDINWYLENKKWDLYDMNILDDAAYINTLKKSNPKNQVELIITEKKGFRKGTNERNPHSWSILDVGNFLEWIK